MKLSRSTARYWLSRLYHNSYTFKGKSVRLPDWYVKMQVGGCRKTLNLGTSNRQRAASLARDIYAAWKAGRFTGLSVKYFQDVVMVKT